jgi:hypothetical protein
MPSPDGQINRMGHVPSRRPPGVGRTSLVECHRCGKGHPLTTLDDKRVEQATR